VSEVALGASGAIFGLFGAWFVVARRLRVDARSIVFLIAINLALPIFVGGIAWQAHVGGLITGILVAAAYAYAPRRQQLLVQAGSTALIVAVLVVAVLVRNHQVLTSTVLR
jgi:membrane associated rhomboid family serine protease